MVAALVLERHTANARDGCRIASIKGGAVGGQGVGWRGAAVVGERQEEWIDIEFVADAGGGRDR